MKTTKDLGVLLAVLGVALTGCPDDGDSTMPTGDSAAESGTGGDDDADGDADDGSASDGADAPGDGDGGSAGDGDDDPDGDDADDGTTDEPADPFVEACEQFYGTYDECFPAYAGGSDCEYLADYLPDDPACGSAIGDYFACLSAVDCATLESYDGFPCRDEFQASHGACPTILGACQIGLGTGDLEFTTCDADLANCIDDRAYHVACSVDGAGTSVDCTCTVDGVSSGSFSLATDQAWCAGEDVVAALSSDCGWPEDIASDLL